MNQLKVVQVQLTEKIGLYAGKAKSLAFDFKTRSLVTAKDHKVQATVASAAGGTVVLGFCCGALGLAAGGVAGGVCGIPFVLFTFGLSIPVSAAIGSGLAATAGVVAGGTAGCATGGAAGYTAFTWRTEIGQFLSNVLANLKATRDATRVGALNAYNSTSARLIALTTLLAGKAHDGATVTKQRVAVLANRGLQVAKTPQAQVTAASATVGGVALGAGGGAVGLATGGIVGAAVGIVPALFTFGLSIPFCAVVGSGAGLCLGTAVGSTTGAVGGGAVGYGVYGKRLAIRQRVIGCNAYAKEQFGWAMGIVEAKTSAAKKVIVADNTTKSAVPQGPKRTNVVGA